MGGGRSTRPASSHAVAELVEAADRQSVTVVYGLSPGLSIRYSDPDDLDRLVAKYVQVASLGVRDFQLLLDDIPSTLQHAVDRSAYPDLVHAHIDLVDRLRRRLDEVDPRLGLAVCPTEYHGRGDGPYLTALGTEPTRAST